MRHDQEKKQNTAQKSHKPSTSSKPKGTPDPNEGEGNRTAARRYDTATVAYVESGRSDEAAAAAAKALDGPEAKELREAETFGKNGHPKRSS